MNSWCKLFLKTVSNQLAGFGNNFIKKILRIVERFLVSEMPSDCACGMGHRCLYELRKNEVALAKEKWVLF